MDFTIACAQFTFLNSLNYSEGIRRAYPTLFENFYTTTQDSRRRRFPTPKEILALKEEETA
jgi:hypothetical protein